MTTWGARAAVLGVFLAGFACGAAGMRVLQLRFESRLLRSPEPLAQAVAYKLGQDLDLTDTQKEQVRRILVASRDEILRKHPDLMTEVAELFEKGQAQIRDVLSPAQREKYERIVAQRRRLMQDLTRRGPLSPTPASR